MGGPIEWNITQIVAPCDLDASFILNNKAKKNTQVMRYTSVSYTHLRAHETHE